MAPIVAIGLVLTALAIALAAERRIARARGMLRGRDCARTAVALCVVWLGFVVLGVGYALEMSSFD